MYSEPVYLLFAVYLVKNRYAGEPPRNVTFQWIALLTLVDGVALALCSQWPNVIFTLSWKSLRSRRELSEGAVHRWAAVSGRK